LKKKALLAENGRLGRLQGIAKSFGEIMSAHRGEVSATVTTAKPLEAQQLKELTSVLQAFLKKGNSLQLETKVNPSLIGGMVVVLGDRYIDLSISSKLNTFSNIVKETL
jgi:F-type H+-transporting ATPase subunit O